MLLMILICNNIVQATKRNIEIQTNLLKLPKIVVYVINYFYKDPVVYKTYLEHLSFMNPECRNPGFICGAFFNLNRALEQF